MKTSKHVLAIALILLHLLGSFSALASEERKSGLFTYALKGNGTAVITKFDWDANDGKDVFIPKFIDGYTVTAIGDSAFATREIERFTGKHYVAKENASIILPDTIVSIGTFAFAFSNSMKINIPSSVEYIGAGAFVECNDTQIILEPKHPYFAMIGQALYNKSEKELIAFFGDIVTLDFAIPRGIVSIGDYAFLNKWIEHNDLMLSDYRKEHLIHPDITSIGDFAFAYNIGDLGIGPYNGEYVSIIPDTVSHIGKGVFASEGQVNSMDEFVIGEFSRIREIPESAFRVAENEIITYPSSVSINNPNIETIGSYAFDRVAPLNFPETSSIRTIDEYAFRRAGFGNFEFPDKLTRISRGMFWGSSIGIWLTENGNKLPEAVRTIESESFLKVHSDIRDLYLPAGITSIETDAFEKDATFVVEEGSYAERWARENGFGYKYPGSDDDELDWLGNN